MPALERAPSVPGVRCPAGGRRLSDERRAARVRSGNPRLLTRVSLARAGTKTGWAALIPLTRGRRRLARRRAGLASAVDAPAGRSFAVDEQQPRRLCRPYLFVRPVRDQRSARC